MADRRPTPIAPATGAPPGASRRESGAVLRGVAVQREPRVLPVRLERRGGGSAGPDAHGTDGLDPTEAAGRRGLEEVSGAEAYRAGGELATSYQQGYQAGRAEAEAESAAVRQAAVDQGWKAGLEQGLREGYERGAAEGREAGRQEIERSAREARAAAEGRLVRLDALFASAEAELAARLDAAEDEMIALCHGVVCRMLGEVLVTRAGVAQLVAQAIRGARGGAMLQSAGEGIASIHVHPDDLAMLESARPGSGDAASHGPAPAHWVADERVQLGGCLVRSADGTLDARLETQLEALRALLLEARSRRPEIRSSHDAKPDPSAAGGRG